MAKKKTKKETEKKEFQYSKELQGLLLILIGVIGFGDFGIVGTVIKGFSIFLCGTWYPIFLVLSLILGIYFVAKRKSPNYFTARLIGLYTIIVAILLFSHLNYVNNNDLSGVDIFRVTIDNIMASLNNFDLLRDTGGGMFGALFSSLFVTLFDINGTMVVVVVLAIFGIVMLFDITLADILKAIVKPFKRKEKKEVETEEIKDEEETNDDGKVVITNLNEIIDNSTPIDASAPKEQLQMETVAEDVYVLPPLSLLEESKNRGKINSTEFIQSNNKILERVFNDFGIVGKVVEVHVGPTVTQYEVELKAGTKVNKVLSINREIALALAAKDVRIQAPIPGKSTIGIEIPNPVQADVKLKDILVGLPKKLENSKLVAPLGKDIMGNIQYFEINKAPHLLVAGATGSGKSVCINNFIVSILMRTKPDEVKLILVDPKKVELSVYEGVPHLLRPVVTDPKKASVALQKVVQIMDERYDLFEQTGTKSIGTYNEYVEKQISKGKDMEKMPFLVVIIDELADLMMVCSKEVEESITRITQLARAAGIHLIVATQRPSTDVITGLIKANIPSRLSFAVSSSIDSRTILDMTGAEKLLGKGDMLFLPMGENVPIRIQGSYVSDEEIKRVVDFVKRGKKPIYDEKLTDLEAPSKINEDFSGEEDPLYNEIVEFAIKTGRVSASLLQRKYRLGYNRAARIVDLLEERGIIGPQNGSKPREVLVKLKNESENVEWHLILNVIKIRLLL